jgi:hypothetical protein
MSQNIMNEGMMIVTYPYVAVNLNVGDCQDRIAKHQLIAVTRAKWKKYEQRDIVE